MKTLLATALILSLATSAPAQRIETQRADRNTVRRVQTMLNHLTVIEFSEPVVMAATGSPAFKIERQGNKVLIQPIEEDAATNLFIWTASGRFSYELAPAASIETADFAIDQEAYPAIPKQVRDQSTQEQPHQAPGVRITDVVRKDGQVFVNYEAQTPEAPQVFELKSPQTQVPLQNLRFRQMDPAIAASLSAKDQRRVSVKDHQTIGKVQAGKTVTGVVTLNYKSNAQPSVLRLVFETPAAKPTSVFIVL